MRPCLLMSTILLLACGGGNAGTDPKAQGHDDPTSKHDAGGNMQLDSGVTFDANTPSTSDRCALPAEQGQCDAYVPSWFFNAKTGQCEQFVYGGCGGNDNRFGKLEDCETACAHLDAPKPCSTDATDPSLPGLSIHVEAKRCNFEVGEPGVFTYRVTLTQSVAYTVEASQGCGSCGAFSSEVGPLVSTRVVDAKDAAIHYCVCDVGCCAPNQSASYTLAAQMHEGTLEWPGRQWDGPSDTSNPLGDVFPKGAHEVIVAVHVPGVGDATAKLPITVK